MKLKHKILGKHARGSSHIVITFIPDRPLFILERYISVCFLYRTGVKTLSTVIRNNTTQYGSVYYFM